MLKALIVVALILLAVAAFCYRPATILGVDGDALAHSVGGGDLFNDSRCKGTATGAGNVLLRIPRTVVRSTTP